MTIEWSNLSSGLLGAVIGSIVGFLGSVFLNWKAERSMRKGAGRAVLMEMLTGADLAVSLLRTAQPHRFPDALWLSQAAHVALALKWQDLDKLVQAYDASSRLSDYVRDGDFVSSVQQEDRKAVNICLGVAQAFLNAIDALLAIDLLTRAELESFAKRLAQLRGQLSARQGKS